ncbi:hypothetical protein [Oerskovia paurometabola]|uniref:hypothetical protein n=1 Tax=Oerskovia paurometabola TaxID=162170 RepID=UPI00382FD366
MSDHIGRSFDGHPLEDTCPCPQEPCGLIDVARIDPTCPQHALAAGATIRQAHIPERCPMTAATSPKPHTPTDLTVSKDAGTTLDNGPVDAGLRTALTKLADKWNNQAGAHDPEAEVRALLAAHPAPTPGEDHLDAACAWSDFRKDYGVSGDDKVRRQEHRAFMAGWQSARGTIDTGGVQR